MEFTKHEIAFILSCMGNNCIRYETKDGKYLLTGEQINQLISRFKTQLKLEELK